MCEESLILHKTRECTHCLYFFDCSGKPNRDILCIKYKERKDGCNFEHHRNESSNA